MNGPLTPMEQGGTWATLAQEDAFLAACAPSGRLALIPLGLASDGTAMRAVVIGSPPASAAQALLLVVASQHGNEPAPREAALRLVRDLAFAEVAPAAPIVVVPTANPWGAAMGDRLNSRGMDINRSHARLATPEAVAIASLVDALPDGAVTVDAHEASNPDASGQAVVGQLNYRAVYSHASPAYRAWADRVPAWVQGAVSPATVAEYPFTPYEGLLSGVGSSMGRPSVIVESLITEAAASRVAWHLAVFKAAAAQSAPSVPAASRAWARREGFAAHAPVFLYEGGHQTAPVGYVMRYDDVPRVAFDAHQIRTVDRWADGEEQYVPMDQPAYAVIPWLIDPRGPRPIAPASPIFPGDAAAVSLLAGTGRFYDAPEVLLGDARPRRLVTADGLVWGT